MFKFETFTLLNNLSRILIHVSEWIIAPIFYLIPSQFLFHISIYCGELKSLLILNRMCTITTTIDDKLAPIKIVKNWKVGCCLLRLEVAGTGVFRSVRQHNKNVKCVETTLTKLCNQSNHSMKSPVIKLPICHSHWSPGHPSTSGINLIKILVASPVSDSITGVSFNMSDLWCHWWGSRSSTQTRVDIITRCVTTQHQYICLAETSHQTTPGGSRGYDVAGQDGTIF